MMKYPPAATAFLAATVLFGSLALAQTAPNLSLQFGASLPLSGLSTPGLLLNSLAPQLKLPAGGSLPVSGMHLDVSNIPSPATTIGGGSSPVGAAISAYTNLYDYTGIDPTTGDNTFGNYINQLIGADAFYSFGVLDDNDPTKVIGVWGQGTYTAVVDAGHPWAGPNGHSTLAGVNVTDPNIYYTATDASGNPTAITDPQSHATSVAFAIAGGGSELMSSSGTTTIRVGIAPLTNLCSGALATPGSVQADGSFSMTAQTYVSTYQHFAQATWTRSFNYYFGPGLSFGGTVTGPTDVISTSIGFDDATGTAPETVAMDALARSNPQTTFCVAAGNSGPAGNSVGGPASGYNVISVGATGDGTMAGQNTVVASFSSRGPQDFAAAPGTVIPAVRPPVDIVAPGVYIVLASYNGPGTDPNAAIAGSGTSFATPIVSSTVSLLDSLSYHLPYSLYYQDPAQSFGNSRDSRVIKAVLMNSADKLAGWNNGQYVSNGVVKTEQGLDMTQGAGLLNASRALNQYIGGTLDPWGQAGAVLPTGWSLAAVTFGQHLDYTINAPLKGGTYLDATLDWFRDRSLPGVDAATGDWDPITSALSVTDLGMAKLDLEIWNPTFTTLYAVSDTSYNDVQELHYLLPGDGEYGIRIDYDGQIFGIPDPNGETFGLAWNGVAVPEPATLACLAVAAIFGLCRWRRKAT